MASAEKKFYTKVENGGKNKDKKYILIDKTVAPTDADLGMIEVYSKLGYEIREKSEKRAQRMKKRAEGGLKKQDILTALEGDEEALEKFNSILNAKRDEADGKAGFFAARKWFEKEYKAKKAKK